MCSGSAPAPMWSSQYEPVTRLPTRRPWRSGNATSTVSIAPATTSFASSSAWSIPRPAITPAYLLRRDVRGGDAAVDHQGRAGHERRVVGGEEQGRLGELLGLAEAAHRDVDHAARAAGRIREEL